MEVDFYEFQATFKAPSPEVPPEKDTGPSPFDLVNNFNNKKAGYDPTALGHIPWIVNKALSFQKENIFFANEMNMFAELTPSMQYDYYWYGIPRGNPWGSKWTKFKITEDEQAVMDFFQYSYEKARVALKILTKDNLKTIKDFQKHQKG